MKDNVFYSPFETNSYPHSSPFSPFSNTDVHFAPRFKTERRYCVVDLFILPQTPQIITTVAQLLEILIVQKLPFERKIKSSTATILIPYTVYLYYFSLYFVNPTDLH